LPGRGKIMERLNSVEAFRALQGRLKASMEPEKPTIVIPAGTCGQASGANDLIRVAKRELLYKGLTDRLRLRITGCHGFCQAEPSVLIEPMGIFYAKVSVEQIPLIIDAAARGESVEYYLPEDPVTGLRLNQQEQVPFFRGQARTLLALNEKIDPIRIFNYLENGGYGALSKVLAKGDPQWVIDEMKASGLRGRGGAGFPTGQKWELLAQRPAGAGKILVCNADEGDPGAYMDRSLLEGNPHSIVEGMAIGAFATGANEGVIYVRNEYPLAIKHLIIALRQAKDLGLIGENILGSGFDFDISLVRGAGAFVCGEETALMRSVEGKIGEPRQRPPFPVQRGIDGKPTAINNVETWANVPFILNMGGKAFARTGTATSKGTKIFSLVGKVKNTGLVEVPMGTTIGAIVNEIGGGPAGSARIKAVQTGGPSGGCIPKERFDLPIDYDSLAEAGSIMGSGGMIVLDENTCMVDLAKYYMAFLKDESCGKCFTCRKGTQRMHELLDDITRGEATQETIELLEELAGVVKDTSLCGLGQTSSNPVLSTLRYFRDEYLQHVEKKRCPAGVCRDLVGAPCQSSCPLGTEAWRYIAHIARGEIQEAYGVIREANPFPSICARVCNHPCEEKCRAGTGGGQPVSIRALKRYVTDRVDPSIFADRAAPANPDLPPVAVVGAGPAGLTAAHSLSRKGFRVTIFEAEDRPGGMLLSAIPPYRLPRDVVLREIECLLDENITLRCRCRLGAEVTVDGLFEEGFKAIFLALGAHKSRRMGIPGEDAKGVYPSIHFLKTYNLSGVSLAKGRVGVIGGGNSAVDAARVALRQKDVTGVTIFYRRTREEMPAFPEEVEAALQEGVRIRTLVSPTDVLERDGELTGLRFVQNELGPTDETGRRRPVPVVDTEEEIPLDTLIVAISEGSDTDCIAVAGESRIDVDASGTVKADLETFATSRAGVFAGGDVVTGPNTVVDAIAAGKRAAEAMASYLTGKPLARPDARRLPTVYVAPPQEAVEPLLPGSRTDTPRAPVEWRRRGFAEVEMSLSPEEAEREARRCLRCDLDFTRPTTALEAQSTPSGGNR
jgi:NADH-quinone oxidoreductase subunit F